MARKVLVPRRQPPKQSVATDRPDSLPVPNHCNRLTLSKLGAGDESGLHYSIICLAMGETPDSAQAGTLAFVDQRHACQSWVHRQVFVELCPACQQRLGRQFLDSQPAPTWMDPEVFVREILTDPALRRLIAEAAGKPRLVSQLETRLQEQLELCYFDYLRKRFAQVKALLARWLVAWMALRNQQGLLLMALNIIASACKFNETLDRGTVVVASDQKDALVAFEELQSEKASNAAMAYAHEKGMREPVLEELPKPYPVDKKGQVIGGFDAEVARYQAEIRVNARA